MLDGLYLERSVISLEQSLMKHSQSFNNDPVVMQTRADSSFRAVKVLVDTQNTLRVAHNRIRVLQVNQQKNFQKMQQQIETIERIERARKAEQNHVALIQLEHGKLQFQQQLSQKNLRGEAMRSQHLRTKQQVSQKLRAVKKQQYIETQENSQQAAQTITHNKGIEKYLKQEARIKVNRKEEEARQHLLQFYQTKQSRIRDEKANEVDGLRTKEAIQQRRLQELGKVEMELIARQSQSRAVCQEVKKKLDSMLHGIKEQNIRSKRSLKPSVHLSTSV